MEKTIPISEILPRCKANRYTYYNLDQKSIKYFQDQYNYLKKYQHIKTYHWVIKNVEDILNNKYRMDYLKKISAMKRLQLAV